MHAKIRSAAVAAALVILLILPANRAGELAAVLSQRLRLCAETLIPSLYGCMAAADLLTASGTAKKLGALLRAIGRALGLNAALTGIFLVSQLAGYPVGAMQLKQEASAGRLHPRDAAGLSYACFGGGPAFLVGLAGVQLFGSAAAGWVMLGACVLANCAAVRILRPLHPSQDCENAAEPHISAQMLTQAAANAADSLFRICGVVLLFGLMTWLLHTLGLLRLLTLCGRLLGLSAQTVSALTAALLDVTQITGLLHCGLPMKALLPLTAGLLSFGGFCVQVQCLALGVPQMRLSRLLLTRTLTALTAALLTALALPLLPLPDAAAVMARHAALSRAGSPLPGLLILLTGFPVLLTGRSEKSAA